MKSIKNIILFLTITLAVNAVAQAKEKTNNYYCEMSGEEIQEAIDSLNHNFTTRTKPIELEVQENDSSENLKTDE